MLHRVGLATLLMDLLTPDEDQVDAVTTHFRFDIGMLAERLVHATDWVSGDPATAKLGIGYFGASTGGGAALVAAAERPRTVKAVVVPWRTSRLAGPVLDRVVAPPLLIVGRPAAPARDRTHDAQR